MCYSIIVETNLRKIKELYQAEIDYKLFYQLYQRRANGEKNITITEGLDQSMSDSLNPYAQQCKELIEDYNTKQLNLLQSKLIDKTTTIDDLSVKLAKKWTKTNQKKLETANRVITRIKVSIKQHQTQHIGDHQIFQYSYAPLIVRKNNIFQIKPFRYQIRPYLSSEEVDRKINMFNARLDSLDFRSNWRRIFMKNHAAVIMKGFFEWVEYNNQTRQIYFFPKDQNYMWAPALFDHWYSAKPDELGSIYSFAIITNDPPKEVEHMGHDRCPIYPKWHHMQAWLNPTSQDKQQTYARLKDREPTYYQYSWV